MTSEKVISIIDYGMSNLGSIKNMLKKLGYPSEISSNPEKILSAEKLILPGVGNFKQAMDNLKKYKLVEPVLQKIFDGAPLLGICLGMQLLADHSDEGNVAGLGIISGDVVRMKVERPLRIPHMGWNQVNYKLDCPLFNGFDEFEETPFYFVHSYHFTCFNEENSVAVSEHGNNFTSAVQKDNIFGVQFHPEKSHKYGMKLFHNFMKL